VADRVAILNGGRIEHAGAPAELRSRPLTSFVQTFLN
jgi:ABC-type proline/glycine betaine transport system ATPase subunit